MGHTSWEQNNFKEIPYTFQIWHFVSLLLGLNNMWAENNIRLYNYNEGLRRKRHNITVIWCRELVTVMYRHFYCFNMHVMRQTLLALVGWKIIFRNVKPLDYIVFLQTEIERFYWGRGGCSTKKGHADNTFHTLYHKVECFVSKSLI